MLKYYKMKWIKIIILCCIVFIISCRKTDLLPTNTPADITDIFKVSQISVSNGQNISFSLNNAGKYTLVLYDTTINQVVSKEKFNGVQGNNVKKIYTTTFNQKTLYLYLTDTLGNKISKTKLLIN